MPKTLILTNLETLLLFRTVINIYLLHVPSMTIKPEPFWNVQITNF